MKNVLGEAQRILVGVFQRDGHIFFHELENSPPPNARQMWTRSPRTRRRSFRVTVVSQGVKYPKVVCADVVGEEDVDSVVLVAEDDANHATHGHQLAQDPVGYVFLNRLLSYCMINTTNSQVHGL